jgi:putative heme-binding domain-containing protein
MSTFALSDGRVVNGLAVERGVRTVTIETPTERLVVPRDEIEDERTSDVSLMPEGLLDGLDDRQIADLIRYLQFPRQIAPLGRPPDTEP